MAVISNFGGNLLLASVFTPDVATPIADLFVALTLDVPHRNITGSDLQEPDSTFGYSRAPYFTGSDYWALNQQIIVNSQTIVFEVPTESWGRVLGWALCDDVDSGNVLACGSLSTQSSIAAGSDVRISIGDLKLRLV
jgi:hypothetical protein